MKKTFKSVATKPVDTPGPNSAVVRGGSAAGQIGDSEKFANPMNNGVNAAVGGLSSLRNDIGESSGFITDGYIDKQGTPYGEAAKFNFLPPGMDISNQENAEIHSMPMQRVTAGSYPGDGWPSRDVKE